MEPETNSDQRPVVPTNEILGRIERGEDVEYDGVIVESDLDLSGLDLSTEHVDRTEDERRDGLSDERKVIHSKIIITNSEIQGNVNFGDARFHELIGFIKSLFCGDVYFRGSNFGGNTLFLEAKFNGYSNFREAEFCGDVCKFTDAEFSRDADFARTKFTGKRAQFDNADFNGDAFSYTKIKFSNNRATSFKRAKFNGDVCSFRGAKFDKAISFGEAIFGGDADFSGAEFTGGNADFKKATFGWYTNFEDAKGTKKNYLYTNVYCHYTKPT